MGPLSDKWARLALLAGWVVLAGGCASPPGAPAPSAPAPPPPQRPADSDKRFVIAPELARVLHVVSVSMAGPPGSRLKIQVNLQNMTDARQRFRYRIEWFDGDGARLAPAGGGFIPWMLMPGEVSSIAATAPAPAAADFGIAFVPAVN